MPRAFLPKQSPSSARVSRYHQSHQRTLFRFDLSICPGQCSNKSVKQRRKEFWLFQPGPAYCIADLLLMVPALGVLTRKIEPDWCRLGTRPVDRASDRERVEGFEVNANLLTGDLEQICQDTWTEPAGRLHPGFIEVVDQMDQFVPLDNGTL